MDITSIFWVIGILSFIFPITLLLMALSERNLPRGHDERDYPLEREPEQNIDRAA